MLGALFQWVFHLHAYLREVFVTGWNIQPLSLRFKCYDYLLRFSILCWRIWSSLRPQTTNRPSLTIWCKSSQVLICLLDAKSYSQVLQLLEWPFLVKNQLGSLAKVSNVKLVINFQKLCLEMSWSHLLFRLIPKLHHLIYTFLEMWTFPLNNLCSRLPILQM